MNSQSMQPSTAAEPLTLALLAAALHRRRALLVWPFALLTLASGLLCFLSTPRYRATTEIQVQKVESGAFGLQSTVTGIPEVPASGDSLDFNLTLQTEASILRSPALAVAVIKAAHLEPTPDYFAPVARGGGLVPQWLHLGSPLEPLSTPLEQAPNRRAVAEKIFKAHLKVQPVTGTRLLDISYSDPDPARAALVANTIAQSLGDLTFEQQFNATLRSSHWLEAQLEDLRVRAEQATSRAAQLQRGTGVYGDDASRNVVLERLDSLNQALTAAENNRLLKESIDQVAANGSPELISSLSGNSSTGTVASINTSLTLLQGMRQQEAQALAELSQDRVRYGPAYPKIAEEQAQLSDIESSISNETKRLGERAHTDWLVAAKQEQGARSAFEAQKKLATRQNDSVIAYQLAKQEADNSRELYESLLSKLKQASLLQGLHANNLSVVSAAQVPDTRHPTSPNIPLWLASGAIAGLFLGAGIAAYRELTDDTIYSLAQVERVIGAPLLGIVPVAGPTGSERRSMGRLLAQLGKYLSISDAGYAPLLPPSVIHDLQSPGFREGIGSLRTALQIVDAGSTSRIVLVTSALPKEGKTTIALDLAKLFSQGGSRVLLVDANLRNPALHVLAQAEQVHGLAMALSGPRRVPATAQFTHAPSLDVLAGSEIASAPLDLLSSPRLAELLKEWRWSYDLVVLDAPAVLPSSDALLLAKQSDSVLLVVRHKHTTHQALARSLEALQCHGSTRGAIGVVLNDVALDSQAFHAHFGYPGGGYAAQVS
ncbi:GNVR domain-containing protein [Acidipila sp. EB88]|uniref:GumC family protein n=1 Tax=Acidipila sp. EB88 TaxID=2305226 RepID=UPI000F60131F|nr:GNVR domain-containing protein [Acidipila sp. EB88]RRA47323.1 hypothetical protein D1Y84_02435 [Acidipila sp. EB88]